MEATHFRMHWVTMVPRTEIPIQPAKGMEIREVPIRQPHQSILTLQHQSLEGTIRPLPSSLFSCSTMEAEQIRSRYPERITMEVEVSPWKVGRG
jgi:hypothetical protein